MPTHTTKAQLYDGFATIGKALASGRRLEIIDVLAQGSRSVEEIAAEIEQSVANTSQHLRVLAASGLVDTTRRGNHVFYELARPEVGELLQLIRTTGADQLEAIERLVDDHLGPRDQIDWITRKELSRRLRRHEVVLVDVRPRRDFTNGHIPGAVSIPVGELTSRADELPRDVDIVAYCRGPFCALADDAVRVLRRRGRRALRLEDGYPEWVRSGLPTALHTGSRSA
jgi:rhodanese-related sulfurtransferase/DNA-binding transcriptional ArsR family regulator